MTPMIHPPAARDRRFTHPQVCGLSLALLLLQTGCAANTPTQAISQKTGPYYQDAQLCRARNPATQLPSGADPAAHLNASGYLKCMNQLGYQQDAKTDPLLVALKKCPQQGTTSVSASGAKAIKPPTPAAVRECLKHRGFPSAGQLPAPTAAVTTREPTAAAGAAPATAPKSKVKPTTAKKERVQTVYIPKRTASQ